MNGIIQRTDWEEAIKIPIEVVSVGTHDLLPLSKNINISDFDQNQTILTLTIYREKVTMTDEV